MHATLPLLKRLKFPAINRQELDTLQVNLGYRCNLRCLHCHVNASPDRTEMMDDDGLELIPKVLAVRGIKHLDLTGGAPELHEGFRTLVTQARGAGVRVTDRCNLTILFEPGQEDLAEFLATNTVDIVASMPCYSIDNVDKQRGEGVFDKSIAALQKLNALGYGKKDTGLVLNLVYNPQGATLPPNQAELQADYKGVLLEKFDIVFNELFAITNMPIKRFGSTLISKGKFHEYMELLMNSYSESNLSSVMCRTIVSVDWEGYLYDCDFNQMLDIPLVEKTHSKKDKLHMRDLIDMDITGNVIRVADHCYGCTAGQGSSCGGAL
ncbi:MAG: arsenosugar biosynthesis radical SAM protein ArsS [Pseudomonadales bacterium]|nr:arsenosugar biosynthesis radical SAM protein ArsS [Pseudomonadales bacterium]